MDANMTLIIALALLTPSRQGALEVVAIRLGAAATGII
jgi:hypothetical protein